MTTEEPSTATPEQKNTHSPGHSHQSACGPDSGCCAKPPGKQDQEEEKTSYLPSIASLLLLLGGIALDYFGVAWFSGYLRLAVFGLAYLLVGGTVLKYALYNIRQGNVFNEFFLMSIATLGAFYIGEYAEGVAVMLFYVIGEHFQEAAVARSRRSIKELIDNRPQEVNVLRNSVWVPVDPLKVRIGEVIQVKAGEKLALDGELLTQASSFNTAALTGESKPETKARGEAVLAGMINLDKLIEVKVTAAYENSALSRILKLVEEASTRKAKTQKFITRFAKIYTPIVTFLAIGLALLPYFFVETYDFQEWLYRALVFLVLSCPCALVISIPLGYFGGIGAASRNGLLFKGSNYLDLITKVDTLVLDKTGTLTEGVFEVQEVKLKSAEFLPLVAALESKSTHPIAKAIGAYTGSPSEPLQVTEVEEIPGHGLKGMVNGKHLLVGNGSLLKRFGISYDPEADEVIETTVLVAVNNSYEGYIRIADQLKADAAEGIRSLRKAGIRRLVMLSGDKDSIVQKVAAELKLDEAYGGLLPEEKVAHLERIQAAGGKVAFVGDGINDAPVITLADVGIAMGGLGSDAAIETADVVIQTDQPSKIATAIRIGRKTRQIVWQNIALAFGVKALVLLFGAFGVASLWEAVFADVGVAFLAILNAIRLQRIKF